MKTFYEGYWATSALWSCSPSQMCASSTSTYPENQHLTQTFAYPKPNHFALFWKLPTAKIFEKNLSTLLKQKKTEKLHSDNHQTSQCRLCNKTFYNPCEYKISSFSTSPTLSTSSQLHPIVFYISSTVLHYYKVHRIEPSQALIDFVDHEIDSKRDAEWIRIDTPPLYSKQPSDQILNLPEPLPI